MGFGGGGDTKEPDLTVVQIKGEPLPDSTSVVNRPEGDEENIPASSLLSPTAVSGNKKKVARPTAQAGLL